MRFLDCEGCVHANEFIEQLTTDNDNLHTALKEVVAYVSRVGGFMAPEDQAVMARARLVLGER